LKRIMNNIHQSCLTHAAQFATQGDYVAGANIAGFLKVADSMIDQGLV
ncbi:MAG: glutamate dehydrogenase, partial [Elusimicrobiaceae bacterium]|nr:glutamate dehydrogenase [Elusimicrobiaceae bacterium]